MKKRNVVWDKLKVIAILGIVMIHMIYHCNIFENVERHSFTYIVIEVLYTLGFSMTNIFVIISSHLLIDRYTEYEGKFNLKKLIKLAVNTSLISTIIYCLLLLFGVINFSIFELLNCLLSVFVNQYWFIGTYILLYLLAPFLTKSLDRLSKTELEHLTFVLIFFFSILPTIMIFVPAQNLYDPYNGKSVVWFVILFITVFYIKKNI